MKGYNSFFVFFCLFGGFTSHSRILHLYGDITITGEGLQILTWHSWPLSSEGSLACHTYCDMGRLFIMVMCDHSILLILIFLKFLRYWETLLLEDTLFKPTCTSFWKSKKIAHKATLLWHFCSYWIVLEIRRLMSKKSGINFHIQIIICYQYSSYM